MKKYVVIVAGGTGSRMSDDLPKQFIRLDGKTILERTLCCFSDSDFDLIVVMNPDYMDYWKLICKRDQINTPHELIEGGKTRSISVKNGINDLENESLVAIHDAARPFISKELINRLFIAAEIHQNAIPVISIKDTLREIHEDRSITVPRIRYKAVQTPQVFLTSVLKNAFEHPEFETFTDEASLVEAAGHLIHLVDGDERNLKITVPTDLLLAEVYLREQSK